MKATFIEMYRKDDYPTWEAAAAEGAVYSSIVHMVDNPEGAVGRAFLEDMMEAAHTAALMMDGNAKIETRAVRREV